MEGIRTEGGRRRAAKVVHCFIRDWRLDLAEGEEAPPYDLGVAIEAGDEDVMHPGDPALSRVLGSVELPANADQRSPYHVEIPSPDGTEFGLYPGVCTLFDGSWPRMVRVMASALLDVAREPSLAPLGITPLTDLRPRPDGAGPTSVVMIR